MKKLLLAATAFTALSAGAAQAVTINFGGGINPTVPTGIISDTGDLSTTTMLTFSPASTASTIGADDTTGVAFNGVVTFANPTSTATSITISLMTGDTLQKLFSGTDDAGNPVAYTENLTYFNTTSSPTGISVNYLGTLDPTGQAVQLNFVFSQTGASGVITGAYTDSSTITVNTPEPATLAILGAGLLGLGLARRRRA